MTRRTWRKRALILALCATVEAVALGTWLLLVDRQLRRHPAPLYQGPSA